MGDKIAEKGIKFYNEMKEGRSNWESHWRSVGLIFQPDEADVTNWKDKVPGEDNHSQLFDGSPEHMVDLLASMLHSFLTNPLELWFGLTTGDSEKDAIPRVKGYLQRLVRRAHDILNNTNFQSEIHSLFTGLIVRGTGFMVTEEDEDLVMRFNTRPIYEVYISENSKRRVDAYATSRMMTIDQATEKYGEKIFGDKLDGLRAKPTEKIEIITIVMPRDRADRKGFGGTSMPIASIHIWKEEQITLAQRGFQEFPAIIPRWKKTGGEKYGRGPAAKALPEGRMLQEVMKTTIRGAQSTINPALLVDDDSIIGRVNMRPGALNAQRGGIKNGPAIVPIHTGARPDIGQDFMDDIRDRMEKQFFIDQLQLREGPQMTAEEVRTRVQQQLRILSPVLGRLHFELLQPLVARIIGIMTRADELPDELPPELEDTGLEVFFTSQIAKAQKITEAQSVQSWLVAMDGVANRLPEALDVLNVDKFTRHLADLFGVSEKVLNDPEEIAAIREERANAEDIEQDRIDQQLDAETAAKVVPLTRTG